MERCKAHQLTRRTVLKSAAAAGTALGMGQFPLSALAGPSGPWSERPKNSVEQLNFAVWSYGKIYDEISAKFTADWSIPLEPIVSPYNQHEAKLATVLASGDSLDVGLSNSPTFAQKILQGLVQPLDDLPGVDSYKDDFMQSTRDGFTFEGKIYGLPYFSAVWLWGYNEELFEKAGFDHAFTSYEELTEQCIKAKKDGVSEYPIIWSLRPGFNSVDVTWFSMVWNQGADVFDKDGNPQIGDGSKAREVLRWLGNTFTKWNISDPESLKVVTGSTSLAFGGGKNLYRGCDQHYMFNQVNQAGRTAISGKMRAHPFPGDGRTLSMSVPYFITTATRDVEWAWKLLQYFGGRTKDGDYTQALGLAKNAMLGSGYKSVMADPSVRESWRQWGDPDIIMDSWDKSTNIHKVIPVHASWYENWRILFNTEVHKVLLGEQDADHACDNMLDALKKVRKT